MGSITSTRFVLGTCLAAALCSGTAIGQSQPAQGAPARASAAPPPPPQPPMRDPYQRSVEIYEYKTTAKSGAQRGEELFYFKCSFCHNRYGKPELLRGLMYGPPLEDLRTRPKLLLTGDPVNQQTVAAKILNGGPAMPAYRHALTEADVADLVAYIFGGKCCVDGDNPPRNPRYRNP